MIRVLSNSEINLQQYRGYCKQNPHLYQDFFLGIPDYFNLILV